MWQRCQYHLQQNVQKYVPREELKPQVAADIRSIFNAPDGKEAERLLNKAIATYEKFVPKLSQWMAASVHEGLTVFALPAKHRARTRTTNGVERVNREIKRRTRVVSIFSKFGFMFAACHRSFDGNLRGLADGLQVPRPSDVTP